MKTKIVLSLAVGITAALVSQPVFAGVIEHQLVLTENSSTSLTATYDGSTTGVTVTFLSRDTWMVLFPQVSFGHSFPAWNEPENSGLLNLILLFEAENHLTLHSDFSAPDFTGAKDGTTFHNIGFANSDGAPVSLTLFDNAGAAEAPETGSTLGLLFLSLVALLGATRLRSLRLA